MTEKRTRFIFAELSAEAHDVLLKRATTLGLHPKHLIQRLVEEGLAREDDDSFELRLFAATQETRRRDRQKAQLCQIAFAVQEDSDEDGYDKLKLLCEEYGVPVDEIMEAVKQYEQSPITSYDSGRGVASAMAFLQAMLAKQAEYPVTVITAAAEEQGFSQNVLKAAKSRLGVASERRSTHWVWKWPAGDEERLN